MIWYDYLITFQMMNTIIAYHDLRPFKVRYTHMKHAAVWPIYRKWYAEQTGFVIYLRLLFHLVYEHYICKKKKNQSQLAICLFLSMHRQPRAPFLLTKMDNESYRVDHLLNGPASFFPHCCPRRSPRRSPSPGRSSAWRPPPPPLSPSPPLTLLLPRTRRNRYCSNLWLKYRADCFGVTKLWLMNRLI